MQPSFTCLKPDELKKFIAGDMSPKRVDEVEDHLSTCETCRGSLEATVGDRDWWQDLESALRSDTADGEYGNTESKESVCQRLTGLLGPTDDPSMLGRIGAYEIIGLLGYGGMGAVFKARDAGLNRYVAVKILLPHLASSGAARARFRREGQAAAAIIDDCVLPIYAVDEWQGIPYLVMQYTAGASLQKRIHDRGPLELREILRVGLQAARGLAAAHAQGLVHRDVKPSNILLDGSVDRALLTDFGLARAVDDASLTTSGMIAGTPQYMSPEQARAETVDHRSDLFSLGSVMYAMCTGHAPFRAESSYSVLRLITDKEPRPIREVNADVPEWLCAIIAKLMAKQTTERFDSAKQVAGLLEECLAYVQHPAIAPLPKGLGLNSSNRYRFSSIGKGMFIMLGSIGMLVLGMVLWSGTQPPDISGKWTSDEWGTVELKKKESGRYEGKLENGLFVFGRAPFNHKQWTNMACANCHKGQNDFVGGIELKWSRLENRFNGTWRISENQSGKLSIRLVEDEIRGGWTTSKKSDFHAGTPRLGDLTWKRMPTGAGATEKNSSEKELWNPYTGGKQKADSDSRLLWMSEPDNSSTHFRRIEIDGKVYFAPSNAQWTDVEPGLRWLAEASKKASIVDPLAFTVDRFNEEMENKFPNHGQPLLTKEELVACASWNELHKENSVAVSGLLSALATRHQLLEGWTILGDFVELPPKDTPVRAFQIVLQHKQSGERFIVRQRFVAPLKSLSNTLSQQDESKGTPLSVAIKRFNATNFRAGGKKQPPLTEEEVIAAILHQQTRRDEYDVSDSLFERLQGIAATRVLPEGATLEVIPAFGAEGDTTFTIWSVRVKLGQDEAGREGWTYAFILREQFVLVSHGDAGRIHWGTPGENGLQLGVRLNPPLTRYVIGQEIDVELFYRNALTKSIEATIPTFPNYSIEVYDEKGLPRRVLESRKHAEIVAGAQVEWIGEQPLSLKVSPIVLAPSTLGPDEEARMLADIDGANLVFVKPGLSYRLKLTASNVASNFADPLSSSEFEFAVDDPD